ncbi:MAG: hypothetical protein ACE5FG_06245 [Myxococcota bacterium]
MPASEKEIAFPSTEWFRVLADSAAKNTPHYRHLGTFDLALALCVGEKSYRLSFEDFGCSGVEEWDGKKPVDCVISASLEDWRALITHIQERGTADPQHTLNSLVLAGDRFRLTGEDQLGIDRFYRFNASLQCFIEEARNVPTQ